MIRNALQRLAAQNSPSWIVRRIPDWVWNWAFDVTPEESLMQMAFADLMARPHITVYEFYDGQEFHRRSASGLWVELRQSAQKAAEHLAEMSDAIESIMALTAEMGQIS